MSDTFSPKFNDWDFKTNAEVVINDTNFNYVHAGKGEKTLIADGGIVTEGTLDTLKIRLSGTIEGTDATDVRSKWGSLLKNLRGTDRVKKGRLDLHGDGHYWCQLVGSTPVPIIQGTGKARVQLEFECDEPFRRANALTSYSEVVSVSDPLIIVTNPTTFSGDAFRIPIVIKPSTGIAWTKNDVIRVQNLTVGWRFEHILTQNLASGLAVILDGEVNEVLENGVAVGEGNSGGGIYLRGGVSNTLSLSGTTSGRLLGAWTVEFWDRFMG